MAVYAQEKFCTLDRYSGLDLLIHFSNEFQWLMADSSLLFTQVKKHTWMFAYSLKRWLD